MTTSLPQPQQTPEQLKWQSDYIQEYYYMVDGTRHQFASFMEDMIQVPDLTVRQLLEYLLECDIGFIGTVCPCVLPYHPVVP